MTITLLLRLRCNVPAATTLTEIRPIGGMSGLCGDVLGIKPDEGVCLFPRCEEQLGAIALRAENSILGAHLMRDLTRVKQSDGGSWMPNRKCGQRVTRLAEELAKNISDKLPEPTKE